MLETCLTYDYCLNIIAGRLIIWGVRMLKDMRTRLTDVALEMENLSEQLSLEFGAKFPNKHANILDRASDLLLDYSLSFPDLKAKAS